MENSTTQNTNITKQIGVPFSPLQHEKLFFVQVLVGVFLYVNCLMIFTFFQKEAFRPDTRYILFAQTLFLDSILMVMTDLASVGHYFGYPIPCIPCVILCVLMSWVSSGTPLTLVAMCLERYVAICMPLRHADIFSSRTRLVGLLLIWCLSSIPSLIEFFAFVASAPSSFWASSIICSLNALNIHSWHTNLRNAVSQLYFLTMSAVIVFTYVKIMAAARAASSENKKSTTKSVKTIVLHAFQLFLCSFQFWCPLIESAVFEIDFMLFINVRYSNFILFLISPRCLSPLIYGLRDEKFFLVMKYYAFLGINKKTSPFFNS
uniref:Odorant receptor, family 91, subfamily A, member 1 n=2 Tax=Scleropages formosus TaxID=113540 RepID=A0A8C9VF62_SCLFO